MFTTEQLKLLQLRMRQTVDELMEDDKDSDDPGRYNYSSDGHSILAVAHCDYVTWGKPVIKNGICYGGQVDDRVGVWVLKDILPSMGVEFDLLLTNDEERCNSTAADWLSDLTDATEEKFWETGEYFETDYNWCFSFDRMGTDAVQYHTSDEWDSVISGHFKLGCGSYSDIAELPYAGINVGCGYYKQHTNLGHVNLQQCWDQIQKFLAFYHEHKDTKYHIESGRKKSQVFTDYFSWEMS